MGKKRKHRLKLDPLDNDASSAGGPSPIDPEPLTLDRTTKEVMANEAETEGGVLGSVPLLGESYPGGVTGSAERGSQGKPAKKAS